jgi:anaerobic selenocysteine-containing dehydrogenase
MQKKVSGYCALCISRCGCISTVRDGVLVSVEPDPTHPTGEHLCIKGRTAPEWVNSPERILTPLKRTNPKGAADPGWQPISWDDALKTVADQLNTLAQTHGRESVAFSVTTPSGTAVSDSFAWINRLAHAFGSPNTVFATENCNWHKDFTPMHTVGAGIGMPEYEKSGCILLWGFNPTATWLAQATQIRRAKQRGAKLIVIDCRKVGMASMADQWVSVRPGSDGVLAMSLAHVMIEQDWFDAAFIRDWSNGSYLVRNDSGLFLTEADIDAEGSDQCYLQWDEIKKSVIRVNQKNKIGDDPIVMPALFGSFMIDTLQGVISCSPAFQLYADRCSRYTPELQHSITGVSEAQLYETARLLHECGPVSYFTWTGTAQQSQASQTSRAISLLYALTGDLDAPGGNVYFEKPTISNVFGLDLMDVQQKQKALGLAERPLGPGTMGWISSTDLYRAVVHHQPYSVKALISFGANPQLTKPPTPDTEKALKILEFYVHADLFMNPTAEYADIVLPVASPWERSGLYAGFHVSQRAEAHIQLRPAVIEPRGESKSDMWIVFQLAKRLGLDDHFFLGDMDRALEHLLLPSSVDRQTLEDNPQGVRLPLTTRYRKYQAEGFSTPTGRLEIYSIRFQERGYDPLPRFEEKAVMDPVYPLLLTSAKGVQFCHSQQRNVPSLRKRMPDPLVEIHPGTALENGISEGDWVLIKTSQGTIQARARYNSGLQADVVCSQYGWWSRDPEGSGHHYNGLVDSGSIDPIGGSNSLRFVRCCINRIN